MARGINETALPEPDGVEDLPTKFDVRQSIITLHAMASDFEMGGMTEQPPFFRKVAKQLAALFAATEHQATVGEMNAEFREGIHYVD